MHTECVWIWSLIKKPAFIKGEASVDALNFSMLPSSFTLRWEKKTFGILVAQNPTALTQRRGRQKGKYNRQLYSVELEEEEEKSLWNVCRLTLYDSWTYVPIWERFLPDMYTNMVCFACLDRINQYSSDKNRSTTLSLHLTQTVVLNVQFHKVLLEHCDMAQVTEAVPSQRFNEPVCMCVCACVCVVMCPSTVFLLGSMTFVSFFFGKAPKDPLFPLSLVLYLL